MEYPFWYVAGIGSPMLIPIVALLHVLVSHFAVGGGILLWLGIWKAYRENDSEFLAYLYRLTRFFVLLTVVFGAITGVGIWWTISLASPQTTSSLIHAFVFGWATEWVTFVLELVSAFGLYYLWGRFSPGAHTAVAFVYAIAAWLSLVLITGITAFMASSGKWTQTHLFWDGFLNPTFLPGVLTRTGGALALTGLYIFAHVSLVSIDTTTKEKVTRWASRWALLGVILLILGGFWWYNAVPAYIHDKVAERPTVVLIASVAVITTFIVLLFLSWWSRREWIIAPVAVILFIVGASGFVSGEFIRESYRKPFTIEGYLYSNNIYKDQVEQIRASGFLNSAKWPRYYLQRQYPELFTDGKIDTTKLQDLPPEKRLAIGQAVFTYHCGVCHTISGYNAIASLIRGDDPELIQSIVEDLDEHPSMPPFAGKPWENKLLVEYIFHASEGGVR